MRLLGTVNMSNSSTVATAAVAPLPLNQTWLRPGAFARLHDPSPAFASGLSDDFRDGFYGRPFADIAKESRQ
jgi:hypothetical protein